jgi:hypothetical protein
MALNGKEQVQENNLMVLTNVCELAAAVMQKVMGNNIANTLEGKMVTPVQMRQALAARAQACLQPYLKKA